MNYLNLDKYLLRALALLCILVGIGGAKATAQQAAPTSITLHIDGLSTEMCIRDSIRIVCGRT